MHAFIQKINKCMKLFNFKRNSLHGELINTNVNFIVTGVEIIYNDIGIFVAYFNFIIAVTCPDVILSRNCTIEVIITIKAVEIIISWSSDENIIKIGTNDFFNIIIFVSGSKTSITFSVLLFKHDIDT